MSLRSLNLLHEGIERSLKADESLRIQNSEMVVSRGENMYRTQGEIL